MIQKGDLLRTLDSSIRVERVLVRTFIILILIGVCTIPVTSLPMVMFPLKPSPATGPYQDTEFLKLANETIYGLSNQSIPNGTALRDLLTTQQNLAAMKISPELYPKAKQINAYLYYTAKSGDEYSDAMNLASKPYSPVYRDESVISVAKEYQTASQVVWDQIKDLYPGVIPYRLEMANIPEYKGDLTSINWPVNPFSTGSSGGLW